MPTDEPKYPEWVYRGKSIRDLIKELQSFDDQDIEVQISIDYGDTRKPISLVTKTDGRCLLMFCGE
ncbi:hypothetical protein PQR46_28685 [Paraburkholderia sediminicola]|jgi:hypothetical protein|uniref:hypothetical protein n=1 Tax=Paraburkholderia TaxID=1822464 RepID=UPI0038BAE79B